MQKRGGSNRRVSSGAVGEKAEEERSRGAEEQQRGGDVETIMKKLADGMQAMVGCRRERAVGQIGRAHV